MEVLVSRLDEQAQINAKLSAKIDHLLTKSFGFDESTTLEVQGLKTALNQLQIPKELKISKSLDFGQAAKQFLFWWGSVSFVVTAVCIWFATTAYKDHYKPAKLEQEQRQWFIDYATEMRNKNPKTHDLFLDKYPFPK